MSEICYKLIIYNNFIIIRGCWLLPANLIPDACRVGHNVSYLDIVCKKNRQTVENLTPTGGDGSAQDGADVVVHDQRFLARLVVLRLLQLVAFLQVEVL